MINKFNFYVVLSGLFFLLLTGKTNAEDFAPFDMISLHHEQLVNGQVQILPAGVRTILFVGLSFNTQNANSQVGLWCGNVHVDTVNDILESHTVPIDIAYPMAYHCADTISTSAVGLAAPYGHFFINYVDRDTRLTNSMPHIVSVVAMVLLFIIGFSVGRSFTDRLISFS